MSSRRDLMMERPARHCKSVYAKVKDAVGHEQSSPERKRKLEVQVCLSKWLEEPLQQQKRRSQRYSNSEGWTGNVQVVSKALSAAHRDTKDVVCVDMSRQDTHDSNMPSLVRCGPIRQQDSGSGRSVSGSSSDTTESDASEEVKPMCVVKSVASLAQTMPPLREGGATGTAQGARSQTEVEERLRGRGEGDNTDNAEHLQAIAAVEVLRCRVKELATTKLELERTRMELASVRDEARRDMAELERQASLNLAATIKKEVDAVKEQAAKDLKVAKQQAEEHALALKEQARRERIEVEKRLQSEMEALRKQAEKSAECERIKAKKIEQSSAQLAEERTKKKIETVQRQMQGRIDALEREKKKQVEEVQREARKEIEIHQRKADQASIRYNRLIAEYNVLEARMSDAASLLNSANLSVKNGLSN